MYRWPLIVTVLCAACLLQALTAWAFVLWSPRAGIVSTQVTAADRAWWDARVSPTDPGAPGVVERGGGMAVDVVIMWDVARPPPGRPRLYELHAGWPTRSLRYLIVTDSKMRTVRFGVLHVPNVGTLPASVRWLDTLFNTIIFFAGLMLLVALATGLVRWWRLARLGRHQCPRCRYPIGTSDVCTECGAELRGEGPRDSASDD
jgi:hypothetical protein